MPAQRPTLLLTRPQAQAEAFAGLCRDRFGPDLPIVIAPLQRIRHLAPQVVLEGIGGIVLTSANAAAALAELAVLEGRTAYCVGEATARAAQGVGLRPIAAEGDAGALVALVRARAPQAPLLYARGATVSRDVAADLSAAGFAVRSAVVYAQESRAASPEAHALLARESPVILPLFSARSAALAGKAAAGCRAELRLAAISEAVAQCWPGPPPPRLTVAQAPTAEAMLAAVGQLFNGASP